MRTSVALCTYNGEKYIRMQLDSILGQTVAVDEIVICDDISTDGTFEILREYQCRHPETIRLYQNEHSLYTVKNFEKAITASSGDWIFLCDQDDIWKPEKVEIMLNFVSENPTVLLLFTDGTLIDENTESLHETLWQKWGFGSTEKERWTVNRGAFNDLLYNKNYVTGATAMISKKLLKHALPFEMPENYYHDSWLAVNAAAKNGLSFIDKELINYRIHKDQQVGISTEKKKNANTGTRHLISIDVYVKKLQDRYFKPSIFKQILKKFFFKKKNTK